MNHKIMSGIIIFITILIYSVSAESIDDITTLIKNYPSVFITEKTENYILNDNILESGTTYSSEREGAIKLLNALLSLNSETENSEKAVPVLINKFPRFIHCVSQKGLYYTSREAGSFQDWIQTKVMGIKTRIELDPPFNSYKAVETCPDFIEIKSKYDLSDPLRRNGKLLNAEVNLRVYYIIYAGACALSQIKGVDYGTEKRLWQKSISYDNKSVSTQSETYTVKPAAQQSYGRSGDLKREAVSYSHLLQTMPLGTKVELQLFSGSVLIGNITEIGKKQINLNVQGVSPLSVEKVAIKDIYLYVYR